MLIIFILNIIICPETDATVLWLCDINHLKREELKENQTERVGEMERGRERKGQNCILMSCTFPHH